MAKSRLGDRAWPVHVEVWVAYGHRLAIWRQFPQAAFTLVRITAATDVEEEFHLGAFELPDSSSSPNGL
jgi:hypothetical protein